MKVGSNNDHTIILDTRALDVQMESFYLVNLPDIRQQLFS